MREGLDVSTGRHDDDDDDDDDDNDDDERNESLARADGSCCP